MPNAYYFEGLIGENIFRYNNNNFNLNASQCESDTGNPQYCLEHFAAKDRIYHNYYIHDLY